MDPFLGEIRLFPYNFVPKGWAACNGSLLPISQNTALFSLLGTMYGGDGRTNFALPDLREQGPLPADTGTYCIAIQGMFPSRD
jgi:microcystin-dependent protein